MKSIFRKEINIMLLNINLKVYDMNTLLLNINSSKENINVKIGLFRLCHSVRKYITNRENPEFHLSNDLGYSKGKAICMSISKIKGENYRIQIYQLHEYKELLTVEIVNKEDLLNLLENILSKTSFEWRYGTYRFEFTFEEGKNHIRPRAYSELIEWGKANG